MTKPESEKVVAGLSCGEVLDRLSDYLDGELSTEARAQLEEHVRGCDWCARFGGEFRDTVRALKVHLARADRLPAGFGRRLRDALDRE